MGNQISHRNTHKSSAKQKTQRQRIASDIAVVSFVYCCWLVVSQQGQWPMNNDQQNPHLTKPLQGQQLRLLDPVWRTVEGVSSSSWLCLKVQVIMEGTASK